MIPEHSARHAECQTKTYTRASGTSIGTLPPWNAGLSPRCIVSCVLLFGLYRNLYGPAALGIFDHKSIVHFIDLKLSG
jgi:hypothetical protein